MQATVPFGHKFERNFLMQLYINSIQVRMKSFPMLILVYMCFLKLPIEYRNYLLIVTIGFAKTKRQQYEWQKDAQISTVF